MEIEFFKTMINERVSRKTDIQKEQNYYTPLGIENLQSASSSPLKTPTDCAGGVLNVRMCNTKILENITKYIEYCYNCKGGSKLNYDGLMDLFT